MRCSAAVLLLVLVLGAFVAASADGGKGRNDYHYEDEPRMKQCRLRKPWSYKTYGCPICNRNDGCVTTTCNEKLDGKAVVKVNLHCLFGDKIGFVAVSYKVDDQEYCVNNQEGRYYKDTIELDDLDCKKLSYIKLKLIVQNKWWFNPDGQDLDIPKSCYDHCTIGKPCHTCIFKDIDIPMCKDDCKPKCPPKAYNCSDHLGEECFYLEPDYEFVKVTLKKSCHRMNSHVAFSYTNKRGYADCVDHTYYGNHDYFSFKAACKSSFNWFLEDPYYLNTKAPMFPILTDDKCYGRFHGSVCDQCGPFGPVKVGYCKKRHDYHDHKYHD